MKIFRLTKNVIMALFLAILLVNCNGKDNEETQKEPLTAEEAKQAITGTIDNFYACMQNLNDGGFSNFFYKSFFVVAETRTQTIDYGNGFPYTRTEEYRWFELLAEAFDSQFGRLSDGQGFKYQALKGKYIWNREAKTWYKEQNNDNITLLFPADKDASSNNATLVFSDYEDERLTVAMNEIVRLPKKGKMSVTIDKQKIFEVVLSNVRYSQATNFVVIESADMSVYANPFTATLNWANTGNNIFALKLDFSSPNGCSTKVNGAIKVKNTDYNSLNGGKDIEKVVVSVSHNDLIISVDADVEGINRLGKDFNKISQTEINTFIKSEVHKGGRKLADLRLIKEKKGEDEVYVPYLYYSDSSSEKAEKYVSDFPERIENIFKRFSNVGE